MSYGVQIRDAAGREIIGPDTFTVRLIETLYLPRRESGAPVVVPAPRARAGMFATVSPHTYYGLPSEWSFWTGDYPNEVFASNLVGSAGQNKAAYMPSLQVRDGEVVVTPPPGAPSTGDMTIYVFATI